MDELDTLNFRTINTKGVSSTSSAARQFRDAMGGFATGVAVVTALGSKNERIGLTINSFASLSIDPPLILWNLSNDSGLISLFQKEHRFNVVFLSEAQEKLALKFARPGEERYKGLKAPASDDGIPLLSGSAGAVECEVEVIYPGGDHVIIVGRVLRFAVNDSKPLLFYRSRFRHFSGE